jgi:hypothetical protein
VRAPWITHKLGAPIITDLSGQELWALAQDGYEPCGFLFEFCRYHVWHVTKGVTSFNCELSEASRAVEKARSIAADKLTAQARACQAEFVVGSDISVELREVPCGFQGCPLDDIDVDVSWFGTGIRRIPDRQVPTHELPPFLLSMIPLGRRRDALIDAEDDSDDVKVAAEDAEEMALEADEDAGDE